MKKKALLIITILIMMLPNASAAVIDGATDIFKTLHVNDGKGYAEFTMTNPSEIEIFADDLSIRFDELHGKVNDYRIEVWGECTKYDDIYEPEEVCKDTEVPCNDQNETCTGPTKIIQNCHLENTYIRTDESQYGCWKEVDKLPSGEAKYRIKADLGFSQKSDGTWGYEIDWIPEIKINENTYTRTEWAWWNQSWAKCRNITIAGPTSTLSNYPVYIHLSNTDYMKSEGADLRFVDASCGNNGSLLPYYEIEKFDTNSVDVWLKFSSIGTSGTTISVYYNNSAASDAQDVTNTWDSNFVGVWHFADGSGTTVTDTKGGDNTGTASSSSWWATGLVDGGMTASTDEDDTISLLDDSDMNCASGCTIMAIVKFSTTGIRDAIFTKGTAFGDGTITDYWAGKNPTNNIYFRGYQSVDPYSQKWTVNTPAISDTSNYHQLVFQWDGTSNNDAAKIYVNGTLSATSSTVAATSLRNTKSVEIIGDMSDGSDYEFDGSVDEYRFSNGARSAAWINYTYQIIANQNDFVTVGSEETYHAPAPQLSNINCTSCNPPYGDSSAPYTTSDVSPTFRFATDVEANCRISDLNQDYSDMGSGRDCETGQGAFTHLCTLSDEDELLNAQDYAYINCVHAENESASTITELEMNITGLEENRLQYIEEGVENSIIWPGAIIYSNQQVYLRDIFNNQVLATVDKVVAYGNQRWLFNYDNDIIYGLFNLTPVVYSLEMANISFSEIKYRVSSLINSTKQ